MCYYFKAENTKMYINKHIFQCNFVLNFNVFKPIQYITIAVKMVKNGVLNQNIDEEIIGQ